MPIISETNQIKLSPWVKKIYCEGDTVYSSGSVVTYLVDTNTSYQEEVDDGDTVLSPKTFTPAKSGWEFVGWKQDNTANNSVLNSLTMGDNPVTLYAVFRQAVTVTYYNGNTTKQTATGYRYYNNGNTVNPTFTIAQTNISGWTARGWSTAAAGNGAITYNSLNNTTITANVTLYAMYQQIITLSYNGNGATVGSTGGSSDIRYYNSGSNAYVNPTFTVASNGFTYGTATFTGWNLNGTTYQPGNKITLAASATLTATWLFESPLYIYIGMDEYADNPYAAPGVTFEGFFKTAPLMILPMEAGGDGRTAYIKGIDLTGYTKIGFYSTNGYNNGTALYIDTGKVGSLSSGMNPSSELFSLQGISGVKDIELHSTWTRGACYIYKIWLEA